MSSRDSGAVVLVVLLVVASASSAWGFNITILLGRFPGFEQFNQLLSRTHLAEQVNSRRTITVLGLPNDRIGTLMQMPEDAQKSILSLHIVLDYYDMAKLNKLAPGNKTTLTTLYQSSGVASDQQGFIDVVRRRDGTIVFGSSVPGSPQVSNFINPVASQPFNISVLSVSQPIIAPGMDGTYVDAAPATPPPAAAAPAPAITKPPPPAASPVEEETPADESPSQAPASSPAPSPAADEPAADEGEGYMDAADLTPEKDKSGARVVSGLKLGLVMGLAALLAAY